MISKVILFISYFAINKKKSNIIEQKQNKNNIFNEVLIIFA